MLSGKKRKNVCVKVGVFDGCYVDDQNDVKEKFKKKFKQTEFSIHTPGYVRFVRPKRPTVGGVKVENPNSDDGRSQLNTTPKKTDY